MQIQSRYPRNLGATRPSRFTVWQPWSNSEQANRSENFWFGSHKISGLVSNKISGLVSNKIYGLVSNFWFECRARSPPHVGAPPLSAINNPFRMLGLWMKGGGDRAREREREREREETAARTVVAGEGGGSCSPPEVGGEIDCPCRERLTTRAAEPRLSITCFGHEALSNLFQM